MMQTMVGAGAVGDDPEDGAELGVIRLHEPQHEIEDRCEEEQLNGQNARSQDDCHGQAQALRHVADEFLHLGIGDGRRGRFQTREVPHAVHQRLEQADDDVERKRTGQPLKACGQPGEETGALNIT